MQELVTKAESQDPSETSDSDSACYQVCHLICMYMQSWEARRAALTLCNPMDCSPLGSPAMEFFRQEYWSGQPFPFPGDLPKPGIEPRFPALQVNSLLLEQPWKPSRVLVHEKLGDITVVYCQMFSLCIDFCVYMFSTPLSKYQVVQLLDYIVSVCFIRNT